LGIDIIHNGPAKSKQVFKLENGTILAAESSLMVSLKVANQILREKTGIQSGIIVVTGSLHIVSLVLAAHNG
jgi:hypothetical protein